MFSGIVESTATVVAIERELDNLHFTFRCPFTAELSIDQSVAHNGVCLTVVRTDGETYTVTAMRETLERSNLGLLQVGDEVNVERSMMMGGRLDGHIVQGHVDQTARCVNIENQEGSYEFTFEYDVDAEMISHGYFTVDKGSVCVNGVSLTVCRPSLSAPSEGVRRGSFAVCIIPYTFEVTNFHNIKVGTVVNIEFDIIGKYIANYAEYLK